MLRLKLSQHLMSETRELDRELEHENLLISFCEMFLLAVSFEAVTFFSCNTSR